GDAPRTGGGIDGNPTMTAGEPWRSPVGGCSPSRGTTSRAEHSCSMWVRRWGCVLRVGDLKGDHRRDGIDELFRYLDEDLADWISTHQLLFGGRASPETQRSVPDLCALHSVDRHATHRHLLIGTH